MTALRIVSQADGVEAETVFTVGFSSTTFREGTRLFAARTKPRKKTRDAAIMAALKTTHVDLANEYVRAILAGEIPACKFVVAACQRQLNDLAASETESFPYRFDVQKAEKVCRVIEKLPHIKGPLAGQRIRLEPWQCFILTTVFGWVSKLTGFRRFRRAYTEVPKGNGKSALSSGVAIYMLALDGEAGAEIYSAATTRDQAKIVFGVAQAMLRRSLEMVSRYGLDVREHTINKSDYSWFRPLSSDADSLEGINPHFVCIDELHAHKTRDLYDNIVTAAVKRSQPLVWSITTAGSNRAGICYEVRSYAVKLLSGAAGNRDEQTFSIIYTVDAGDDWALPATWVKANPNWNVSVFADAIALEAHEAVQLASKQPAFKTKHLNVWVNADSAWLDMRKVEACIDVALMPEIFKNKGTETRCNDGLDLASKLDLACTMLLFTKTANGKRDYTAFGRYWLGRTVGELAKGNFKGAWEEVKSGSAAAWNEAKTNAVSAIDGIKSSIEGIKGVWTASLPTADKTPTGPGRKVSTPVDLSFIDAAVTKYQSEEKAAEGAAAGIGKATEATILATAEAKAQKDIDTLVAEAQKKKVDGTAAFAAALDKAIPKIEQAAQFTAAFNAASEDSKGLESFISKTNEQATAYNNQSNALGAVAREQAAYTAKLTPYLVQITELEKVQKDLSALYGENDSRVLALSARIDTLKNEYQQATVAVNAHNSALQSSKIQEAIDSSTSQLTALQKTTSALESGGEAYAKIDQQVQKFALDTNASAEAQERYRAVLVAINAEQQKQAALNLASPGTSQQAANLQIQITALEQIRTEWQGLGKDTTGVDQALRTVNADYQDLQAKTGGFTAGATAAFADFAKDVQSDGQIMQNATVLRCSRDSLTSSLATHRGCRTATSLTPSTKMKSRGVPLTAIGLPPSRKSYSRRWNWQLSSWLTRWLLLRMPLPVSRL